MALLPTIEALGTTWWIEVFDEHAAKNTQIIFDDLRVFINAFDDKYSRFKPASLLCNLNDARHLQYPDQQTIEILNYGLTLYRETDGVFNFLVGERMVANGYDPLYSFTPKDTSPSTPNPTEVLHMDPKKVTLVRGQIDIGGYGKGFLIDLVAERLINTHHCLHFLINGGGDMYGTSEHGEPISIYLEHPALRDTYLTSTTLLNEGFAASSTHKRRWENAGKVYTHIVDTKTGDSSVNSLGIFVKAQSAREADAWATTLLISAPENHLKHLEEKNIRVASFNEQTGSFKQYGSF